LSWWPPASTANYFGDALSAFGLAADVDLRAMRPGQSLGSLTSRILSRLDRYLEERRPAAVLGHGDTTSTLSAALGAFYRQIPFFHVEAGLRSGNLLAPYPEEFNRRSVAPLAALHFAPTAKEKNNLLQAGVPAHLISVTGSTIQDAVNFALSRESRPEPGAPYVLVTLHRREALGTLEATLSALDALARERPGLRFLCPLHPNPAVRASFRRILTGRANVHLREPLPYPDFLRALAGAKLVVTDSGGVQEEAAFLGKRTLLARAETERADGIAEGLVHLAGRDPGHLRLLAGKLLGEENVPVPRAAAAGASKLIAARVKEAL
jgi:UDP-N-acetylglucosamine 2-epimerase (non-hydrolysing)